MLEAYHAILIPKAIEYSAGILDYFFRGRLAVATVFTSTPGKVGLRVTNKSGQGFKGGTFKLYYDDAAGTRTEISGSSFTLPYSGASTLADGASITGEFTPPSPPPVAYFLVYKGTIGFSGSSALDPIDENYAIAAKRFTRDAFIDALDFSVQDLAEDGTVIGHKVVGAAQRPYYYSGLTRTSQDTRTSIDSSPITVSQAGTTVTANDTFFKPAHVGRIIKFSSGEMATITAYVSSTQVTVAPSQTVGTTTLSLQGGTLGGSFGEGSHCTPRFFAGSETTPSSGPDFHVFWLDNITGEIRDIGGPSTGAIDIDAAGWLLLTDSSSGPSRARLYNPATQTSSLLELLSGSASCSPVAMNSAHVVALNSDFPSGSPSRKASRWNNGTVTSIHPGAAGTSLSECRAINASGTIIGHFDLGTAPTVAQAFINFGGSSIHVGHATRHTAFHTINDNDVVAGEQQDAAFNFQPFKWTLAGGFEFIPLPAGMVSGTAHAINNAGDVVGEMIDGTGQQFAFLRRGSTTHELIDLIPPGTDWTSLDTAQL